MSGPAGNLGNAGASGGHDAAPAMPRGAWGRRLRFAALTGVLLLSITAACVFAGVLATRFDLAFDATAAREHELSDRTIKSLDQLTGPHELVVTVNSAGVDRRAAVRTQNILDAFDRRSDALTCTLIDVADPRGIERLDGVLRRIAERFGPELERQQAALAVVIQTGQDLAQRLEASAASLDAARAALKPDEPNAESFGTFFESAAAVCRVAAQDLGKAAETGRQRAAAMIGATPVPAVDDAQRVLRQALQSLEQRLRPLAEDVRSLAAAPADRAAEATRASSAEIDRALTALRDNAARAMLTLDELPRLPLTPAARILESSSAALVIGPTPESGRSGPMKGIAAVDVGSLFPPAPMRQADGSPPPLPDTRARAEELLTAAIESLAPREPITAVIVHGAGEGERLAPEFAPVRAAVDRLRLRGIEVLEWAAATERDPPPAVRAASGASGGAGAGRVVYVTISTQAASPGGAARMGALAAVIDRLIDTGAGVLLSVTPSELPAVGQPDPMVEAIARATGGGVKIDSARPLLRKIVAPRGAIVSPDISLIGQPPGAARHPVAAAVEGLRITLPWCSPIRIDSGKIAEVLNLSVTPLLIVEDDDAVWAESEWTGLWTVPRERLSLVANPPSEGRRDDGAGPWTVAAAIRRTHPLSAAAQPQRIVVVGANLWFLDEFTAAAAMVGNRPTPINPGNLELLESSIYWLAYQDEAIARGIEVSATPTIPALTGDQLTALRWGLIGGLPVITLLLGALWRILRG